MFLKFSAGLIRMRVLFEGGSLSRIYGILKRNTFEFPTKIKFWNEVEHFLEIGHSVTILYEIFLFFKKRKMNQIYMFSSAMLEYLPSTKKKMELD